MIKKNFPLIAGIGIPVLMILFVAGSIYLPGIFIKPKYNFLYVMGSFYGQPYFVQNGQLMEDATTTATNSINHPPNYPYYLPNTHPQLFVYDLSQNKAREISFSDAQKLALDADAQSADGFQIVSGGGQGGSFLFSGGDGDYNSEYLEGHDLSRKLAISTQNGNDRVTFLGWINN